MVYTTRSVISGTTKEETLQKVYFRKTRTKNVVISYLFVKNE